MGSCIKICQYGDLLKPSCQAGQSELQSVHPRWYLKLITICPFKKHILLLSIKVAYNAMYSNFELA